MTPPTASRQFDQGLSVAVVLGVLLWAVAIAAVAYIAAALA